MRKIAALLLTLFAALPASAQSVLRYAPAGDLRVLDPIWTSAAITVTHAQLVYDVLVTLDSNLKPRLQMAESVETSPDGLTWTFTLRPGLAFHDGSPVRAQDVAASIKRWARRVTTGQAMMPRVASIEAVDARTLRLQLSKPFGPVMDVLATSVLAPFVMREQEASVDAFEQVKTVIGSGPFIWDAAGYQPGHRATYRRNPAYIPRNHLVEEMISAAVDEQDYAPFEAMLRVLMNPFEEQAGAERYAAQPPESETGYRTFCGT